MADTPHQCFTVDDTAYIRSLAPEDRRGTHVAVHYAKPPRRTDDGRTSISLVFPMLLVSLYFEDQRGIAEKVARILNQHWDDDVEPSCAACGKPASEHLGKGDCAQFLAPADVVDKAAAWDAATAVPPKVAKELADLKAQGERQTSTIAIHHQNFDEIYERACRETGEFAEWVRSITHPEAEQR